MNRYQRIMTAIAFLGTTSGASLADTLRVDINAAPGGDGSSWSRAFDSLTDALAAASSGDQVWVAKGVYIPDTPAGRDATFTIPDGVGVYGGFSGGESSLAQRGDPLDPETTLSGQGVSYHVVSMLNAGPSTVLDGFFIIRGLADGAGLDNRGAGITADDSSPVLRNLVIRDCEADGGGGAISLRGVSANFTEITGCFFEDNLSGTGAAGLFAETPISMSDCVFDNCDSASGTGAIRLAGGGIHAVSNSEFIRNDAGGGSSPGAIAVFMNAGSAFTSITDCVFRLNTGTFAGAVSYNNSLGTHEIRGSRFHSNTGGNGPVAGAIHFTSTASQSDLLVENSLLTGNTTTGQGAGGLFKDGEGTLRIVNTTIAQNTSVSGPGGGLIVNDGSARVDNSILWDNDASGPVPDQDDSFWISINGAITVNRSIIHRRGVGAPVPPGVGSFASNPLFVDMDGPDNTSGTTDDNVRLMPGSPAIDRGNNLVPSALVFSDIYGDPRFADDPASTDTGVPDGVNPIVDLGCAEFQPPVNPGCNPADLAEPFGTLDFADVLAFLSAFGAMGPAADLASPSGVFDFADVLAFLTAFGAGCP